MQCRGNEDGVRTSFFQTRSFSRSDLAPSKKTSFPTFRTLGTGTRTNPSSFPLFLPCSRPDSSRGELPRPISKIHIPSALPLEDH